MRSTPRPLPSEQFVDSFPDPRGDLIDFETVFLGDPNETSPWPDYPTIKLGDFGNAIRTYPGDPYNSGPQHWAPVRKHYDAPVRDLGEGLGRPHANQRLRSKEQFHPSKPFARTLLRRPIRKNTSMSSQPRFLPTTASCKHRSPHTPMSLRLAQRCIAQRP